jgi:hypothetical protein
MAYRGSIGTFLPQDEIQCAKLDGWEVLEFNNAISWT